MTDVNGASTVLKLAPLLADLDDDEIQVLAGAMQPRTFRPGEVVTAEGSGADGFFVVESGEAGVTVQGESRGSMGPGDCFGEVALLMGSERTATITATSDLHCYALTPADFGEIVEGNPAIAWKFMQSMADRLS
jgi:monovalent cation:H+ antiporter-2, CPA2 family